MRAMPCALEFRAFSANRKGRNSLDSRMFKIKKIIWVLQVLVIVLASATESWAGQIVTAVGTSFFEPGREALARNKALDEAKRAAVEEVVGAHVISETTLVNQRIVKDRVRTYSSGYMKNVKIISERKNSLGAYEVTIQAEVQSAALIQDMDRLFQLVRLQQNPRVAVFLEPGVKSGHQAAGRKAMALLTQKLKNNNFKVYQHTSSQRMGLLIGLVIESASHQSKYQDLTLNVNEISLTANMYRQGDNEILAAARAVETVPGPDRLRSLDKGVTQCVSTVWKELRRKLIHIWEKEFFSHRDIELVVNNVASDNRANELTMIFQSDISGVKSARLMAYTGRKAAYEVQYRGWPQQLLDEMRLSYFENQHFKVKASQISGNQLTVEIDK